MNQSGKLSLGLVLQLAGIIRNAAEAVAYLHQRGVRAPELMKLVREVAEVVRIMPLWKLQTVGREHLDFLYANTGAGNGSQAIVV